ncbi:MAG: hypothetical protein ACOVOQ_01510, partial [Flavobacterium sp.]
MRQLFSKYLFLYVFVFLNLFLNAQQKDSLVSKPNEVKEDINVAKKRKFIYLISDRLSDDDK